MLRTERKIANKNLSKGVVGLGGLLLALGGLIGLIPLWSAYGPGRVTDLEFVAPYTTVTETATLPVSVTATPEAVAPTLQPTLPSTTTPSTVWGQLPSSVIPTEASLTTSTLTPIAAPTVTALPASTATPTAQVSEAWRLIIPSIDLNVVIVGVGMEVQQVSGQSVLTWDVPDFYAAGWHTDSARPGAAGNMVLNGHNNVNGKVFRYLDQINPEDEIIIRADGVDYRYIVTERHLIKDKWVSFQERMVNAQWIQPTADDRLTLVTCWPYTSNTHRLIVVARPVLSTVPAVTPTRGLE